MSLKFAQLWVIDNSGLGHFTFMSCHSAVTYSRRVNIVRRSKRHVGRRFIATPYLWTAGG